MQRWLVSHVVVLSTLATAALLTWSTSARADVPGAPPPVNPCKHEGFDPAACPNLPTEKGVCVSLAVGAPPGNAIEALTKEGFTKRCTAEYFHAEGPYRYQSCVHEPRERWCRDARLDGLALSHAVLCDLEAYEGCPLDSRVYSNNTKVVAKTCVERADSLKSDSYRALWARCRAPWEANGIALPIALLEAGTTPESPTNDTPPARPSGCGRCAVSHGEATSGTRVALAVAAMCTALTLRRRRRVRAR